jgi:hypothetical protein
MSHTIVTYSVKPGREGENAALVRAVFDELATGRPAGFRYAVFQAADSGEFLHLYTDEGARPGALQRLPAFRAFVAGAADRHEQPATFGEFKLIGGYRTLEPIEHTATHEYAIQAPPRGPRCVQAPNRNVS